MVTNDLYIRAMRKLTLWLCTFYHQDLLSHIRHAHVFNGDEIILINHDSQQIKRAMSVCVIMGASL